MTDLRPTLDTEDTLGPSGATGTPATAGPLLTVEQREQTATLIATIQAGMSRFGERPPPGLAWTADTVREDWKDDWPVSVVEQLDYAEYIMELLEGTLEGSVCAEVEGIRVYGPRLCCMRRLPGVDLDLLAATLEMVAGVYIIDCWRARLADQAEQEKFRSNHIELGKLHEWRGE